MKDGIKIVSNTDYLHVQNIKVMLESAGIDAYIMDRRDSSYPGILGTVELYISASDLEKAKAIIEPT
jgi:hypothetical protein